MSTAPTKKEEGAQLPDCSLKCSSWDLRYYYRLHPDSNSIVMIIDIIITACSLILLLITCHQYRSCGLRWIEPFEVYFPRQTGQLVEWCRIALFLTQVQPANPRVGVIIIVIIINIIILGNYYSYVFLCK